MAILSGTTVAAKLAFLKSMEGDTFKAALYDENANLNQFTEEYITSGEVRGQGYKAGGQVLRGVQIAVDGVTACMTFDTVIWPNATIKARGVMIYNASKGNLAITVGDFGEVVSSTNGNWKLPMPPLTSTTAVVRIS